MNWGVNNVMLGSNWQVILVIFEKRSFLRFEPGRGQSSAFVGSELRLDSGPGSSAGELTVGDVRTVSIVKNVSLSPRAEKLKVKK